MAQQAGVGAFFLAETLCRFGIRNVVNLMIAATKQQGIHDPRHVAGNAAAALRVRRVMRMTCTTGCILKLLVASRAHEVWLIAELRRRRVRSGIVAVRIVAGHTTHAPFFETLRTLQSFDHKRRLPKPSVLVKAFS